MSSILGLASLSNPLCHSSPRSCIYCFSLGSSLSWWQTNDLSLVCHRPYIPCLDLGFLVCHMVWYSCHLSDKVRWQLMLGKWTNVEREQWTLFLLCFHCSLSSTFLHFVHLCVNTSKLHLMFVSQAINHSTSYRLLAQKWKKNISEKKTKTRKKQESNT